MGDILKLIAIKLGFIDTIGHTTTKSGSIVIFFNLPYNSRVENMGVRAIKASRRSTNNMMSAIEHIS